MTEPAAFRYHMYPLDLCSRAWHIRIRKHHPQLTDWLFHLTVLAQNARAKGAILIGGHPAEAEDIALAWDHRATEEDIEEWESVLVALADAGVVRRCDEGWEIAKPSLWYRPPSREPEAEAQRKRLSRADVRTCPQASAEVRIASGVSGPNQNQNQNENQNKNQNRTGKDASSRRVGVGLVVDVLDRYWPDVLPASQAGDIARYLNADGTMEQKLEAIRQVADEVVAELEVGSDIRFPRKVVLHRAPARLAQLRTPAAPHAWTNPPQPPEYVRVLEERERARRQAAAASEEEACG